MWILKANFRLKMLHKIAQKDIVPFILQKTANHVGQDAGVGNRGRQFGLKLKKANELMQ